MSNRPVFTSSARNKVAIIYTVIRVFKALKQFSKFHNSFKLIVILTVYVFHNLITHIIIFVYPFLLSRALSIL